MFGLKKEMIVYSPIEGEVVAITKVPDPTFNQEMLGKGVAINPIVGTVIAPFDGSVELLFDTKHAISLKSETGIQLLIHVGIDTVSLRGASFKSYVRTGDRVKKGDLLLEFNIEAIKKAGLNPITPVVICNSCDYKKVTSHKGRSVQMGDKLITLVK